MSLQTCEPLSLPLTTLPDGTLRIGNTRIPIDTVIHYHNQGYTPEKIVDSFDTLKLADVYAVIAYYLNHRAEVDVYLEQREREATEFRMRIEAEPDYQEFRKRLLERKTAYLKTKQLQESVG